MTNNSNAEQLFTPGSFGLRKVILVDGHIAGKITRLDLSAHATLIGTNGAGKTTLLKLLPLFYGIAPNQLESRASGKKSFLDWYLPRPSSVLVFEYQRAETTCCVVVYRHSSGTKPAYRFLSAGFTEDAFSGANRNGGRDYVLAKDLGRHWRQLGLECSRQIEVITEYRAIIQRDRSLINRSTDARDLRFLAGRYGLGAAGMQHVEKVVHALLGRQGSMDKIRLMLAAIMRDEGVSVPKLPSHQRNESAIAGIGSLRQLKKELPKLQQIVARNDELLSLEASLLSIDAALAKHREQGEVRIEALDAQLLQLEEQLHEQTAAWETQRDELNRQLSRNKGEAEHFDAELSELDQQRDQWEQQDMETWAEKLQMLPRLQDELDDARRRNEALCQQHDGLTGQFEQRKVDVSEALHREQQRIAERRQKLQGQRTELADTFAERREALVATYREQASAELESLAEQRDTLVEARAMRAAQVKDTGYSEQETQELRELEAEIELAEQQLKQEQSQVQQSNEVLAAARRALEQARRADDAARAQQAQYQQQHDELERLCYPDDQSLLSSLRQQRPQWVGDIGKVIHPDLLARTDIAPELAGAGDDAGFYGLQLALDRIEAPEFAAGEQQLQARLQAAAAVLASAHKELIAAGTQLELCHEQVVEAEHVCSLAKQQHSNEQRRANAAREVHKAHRQRCEEALTARRDEAKQRLADVEGQLQTLKQEEQRRRQALDQRESQAKLELKAARAAEDSALQERETEIDRQSADAKQHHKEQLKQIESDLQAALKEDGIDDALLVGAAQDVKAAQQAVDALASRRERIHEYQTWRSQQWPRRPKLLEQLNSAQQQIETHNLELEQGEVRFGNEQQTLRDKKLELQRELRQQKERLEAIRGSKRRIAAFDKVATTLGRVYRSSSPASRSESVDSLLQEADTALEEREPLLAEVQRSVNGVDGVIHRGGGSIADAWREHCNELAAQSGISEDDGAFWRLQPKVVQLLVEEAIPTAERQLVDTMAAIGSQVNDFHIGLSRVKTSIQTESRRISDAIQDALCFDVLGDIRVRLNSRVEELEYWQELEQFHEQWRLWQDAGGRDLPVEAFTENLDTVLKLLRGSRITGDVETLFDLVITLTENGRQAEIRNDRDLQEVSSTGLSFLALCSIFVGLTRLLCPDRSVNIHWPLDELGTLAPENVARLFKLLSDNGIVILGGFPSNDLDLLKHFEHRYVIDRERGLVEVALETDELALMLNNSQVTEAAE